MTRPAQTRRRLAAWGLTLGFLCTGCGARAAPVETIPPRWIVGQTYVVVWDCAPVWLTQMAARSAQSPPALSPCYDEALTVEVVRADGWLEVRDVTGARWIVNPARAIGVQLAP